MQDIPPAIAVAPVHQLPMIKAYADPLGLVGLIHHDGPTAMEVEAGTVVLGLVLDTRSGRSPLSRLEAWMAPQDTARLVGQALPAHAFNDDPGGRVLARRYDRGTMKLVTACAVRAVTRLGLERRSVHVATTSRRVWGEDPCAAEQDVPFRGTDGDSQEKRPDLQPCVLSMRCVDRAGPRWGKPDDGHASDTTLQTTRWSELAPRLARQGVPPGASIDRADAALGTADTRAALGDSLVITRVPAPYSAGARVIAAAVAHHRWEEVGVLAQTPPTTPRPTTVYPVAAGRVT